jgi:hypothetical protein
MRRRSRIRQSLQETVTSKQLTEGDVSKGMQGKVQIS